MLYKHIPILTPPHLPKAIVFVFVLVVVVVVVVKDTLFDVSLSIPRSPLSLRCAEGVVGAGDDAPGPQPFCDAFWDLDAASGLADEFRDKSHFVGFCLSCCW